jgi:hypothetical protein
MDPDIFDYDLNITNTDLSGLNIAPQLVWNETRPSPYLNEPWKFQVAPLRYNIESQSLPFFIPVIETGQTDINKTIYKTTFTFNYGGSERSFTSNVMWQPQNFEVSTPSPADIPNFMDNKYWYCYSIQQFTDCINKAFADTLTGLNSLVVSLGGTLPTSNPPFLEVNPTDGNFILNSDILGYKSSLVNPIKIYLNTPLFGLLNSFDAYFYGHQNVPKNYLLKIRDTGTNNLIISPTYTAIQSYTEYSPIPNWNPVSSIVFTTNWIPMVGTFVGLPSSISTSSNYLDNVLASNIQQRIITDFSVALSTGLEYRPIIQYAPTAELRWVQLTGSTPLNIIDINVYWKDKFNKLHPFVLYPGASASIKLRFKKVSN